VEYTVKKLSNLANITARTLRYYDEIGILKPARINSSGYRIYGEDQIDKLQQILFYRELGVELEMIREIITATTFDGVESLKVHHKKLLDKKKQLELLIENVEKTIAMKEGRIIMTDKERFEGFKQKLIDDNKKKYGNELIGKYGNEVVASSNLKLKNMSKKKYDEVEKLEDEVNSSLKEAFEQGDSSSQLAQKVCELHKKWIMNYWNDYSKEAHMSLVQMYVDDSRFTEYYDKISPGCAVFLRDAMKIYTGIN
jgi:DNA-binding transcriptional MerR regulator